MNKSVLLISYHFYPGTAVGAKRPSELALRLKAEGFNVSVIACSQDKDVNLADKIKDIKVTYIPEPPNIARKIAHLYRRVISKPPLAADQDTEIDKLHDIQMNGGKTSESLLQTLKRWFLSMEAMCEGQKIWMLMLWLTALPKLLFKKHDIVITSGPPMAAHYIACFYKRFFDVKWIMDLRDPFPVLGYFYPHKKTIDSGTYTALRKKIEVYLERKCVLLADQLIVTAPSVERELNSRYDNIREKVLTIYNGYDQSPFRPAVSGMSASDAKVLTFLYAGTIYFNRNPFPLLEGLKSAITEGSIVKKDIKFDFYGDCKYWNGHSIQAWIDQADMADCIRLHLPVSSQRIKEIIDQADVLVNFCQGQPMAIPAKTYEYIATHKLNLVLTERDSDTAKLINEVGVGMIADPEQDNLSEILIGIYSDYINNNRSLPKLDSEKIALYSRESQNTRYLDIIHKLYT